MIRRAGWLLIPVLFALLVLTEPVRRAELWAIDQRFKLRQVAPHGNHVVVVALDERADIAWKSEPFAFWGEHLAGLVDKCSAGGARSIGIDLVLQVDTDAYLEDHFNVDSHLPNLALENALAGAGGKVVLARTRTTVPVDSLVEAAAGKLGLADLPENEDGLRRTVTGSVRLGGETYQGFANSVAANAGYPAPASETWWIDFRKESQTVYSALDVLSGRVPSSTFRDKIVLIGTTFPGTGDFHDTPIEALMPGLLLQAQAVATLADGKPVEASSRTSYALFSLLSSLLVMWLSRRMRWGRAAIIVVLALIAYTVACYASSFSNLFLPVVPVWISGVGSLLLLYSFRSAEEFFMRAKVEATFGAFVSNRVRDVVLAHQGPVGTAPPIEIEATCLLLDIREFVVISSNLSPSELVETLNSFFEGALAAVDSNEGLVSVFTGDGFLAVFGAPIPNQRHAECAWQAAQQILEALESFNANRPDSPWRIGIGLHSGPVFSGYVGAAGRYTYTVMGDTVNMSARIQDSTKAVGKSIGISEQAWLGLQTPPQKYQWVQVPIKGKDAEVPIYYV